MTEVRIKVSGLEKIEGYFKVAPLVTRKWLSKAIKAGILEVQKQAVDSNFQFKTPRPFRTGLLQQSFKFGLVIRDTYASIGPTVRYAEFVHEGTSRVTANPFMIRIAKASEKDVQKHFDKAGENIEKEIAKGLRSL